MDILFLAISFKDNISKEILLRFPFIGNGYLLHMLHASPLIDSINTISNPKEGSENFHIWIKIKKFLCSNFFYATNTLE